MLNPASDLLAWDWRYSTWGNFTKDYFANIPKDTGDELNSSECLSCQCTVESSIPSVINCAEQPPDSTAVHGSQSLEQFLATLGPSICVRTITEWCNT